MFLDHYSNVLFEVKLHKPMGNSGLQKDRLYNQATESYGTFIYQRIVNLLEGS